MMGFAGQLSLGHALYVGLGAYAAAALFVHFGMLPWLGIAAGVAVAALAGAIIAALSFRFAVAASISRSSPSPSTSSRASCSIISTGSAARPACSCR